MFRDPAHAHSILLALWKAFTVRRSYVHCDMYLREGQDEMMMHLLIAQVSIFTDSCWLDKWNAWMHEVWAGGLNELDTVRDSTHYKHSVSLNLNGGHTPQTKQTTVHTTCIHWIAVINSDQTWQLQQSKLHTCYRIILSFMTRRFTSRFMFMKTRRSWAKVSLSLSASNSHMWNEMSRNNNCLNLASDSWDLNGTCALDIMV